MNCHQPPTILDHVKNAQEDKVKIKNWFNMEGKPKCPNTLHRPQFVKNQNIEKRKNDDTNKRRFTTQNHSCIQAPTKVTRVIQEHITQAQGNSSQHTHS